MMFTYCSQMFTWYVAHKCHSVHDFHVFFTYYHHMIFTWVLLGTRLKPLAKPTSTWKGADKRPCLGWERQLCETEEWMTCWKEQFKFKHPRLAWETQLRKMEREEQMLGWKEERIDHLYSWHPNDWLISLPYRLCTFLPTRMKVLI